MKGMIVFSYALRDEEPNLCNVRLAKAVFRIVDELDEPIVLVSQRTVLLALRQLGAPVAKIHVVEKRLGEYEGSEEVVKQATEVFLERRITEVIPVAQPFLQLTKCVQLVRKAGFRTPSFWKLCRMIGWIGFDPKSKQPGTRGPVRSVLYTIRQMLFGYRPPPELSE